MKKYKIILLLFVAPFFLSNGIKQNKELNTTVEDKWSGTVTRTQIYINKGKDKQGPYQKDWDHFNIFRITANFVNNRGTVIRADTTNKLELDTTDMGHGHYNTQETTTKIYCNGKDPFDLSVEINEDNKTYWISFFTPDCPEIMIIKFRSNILPPVDTTTIADHPGTQINIPDQKMGNNPNELKGRIEEHFPPSGPGGNDIYITTTWDLKKVR